ncbi:MAG TPA: TauD/TfdA family dioxygenase [Pyrinomonadaceae bacterium]|nr:TauD/TfdA family dioxygenase [Pyrinomonadaceae bacterium]
MLAPFPDSARIVAPAALARELFDGAERLQLYDNQEFYSPALQEQVWRDVRAASPEGFDWLVGSIRERIARWPYCVLVSGLRFDEGNRVFVAVNRSFGEMVALPYKKPRAQLVHYIQPATDIHSPRGGRESERLHTDAANWVVPIEMISMVCVRPDRQGGGRSRALDVDTVRDEIEKQLGAEALERLETEPVPWRMSPLCGGGLRWRTVLTKSGRMCWRRDVINLALELDGVRLSGEMLALLDDFERVITQTTRTIDFLLAEGEMLFSDNTRTIHSRTPIANADASNRLMIRSWIRVS